LVTASLGSMSYSQVKWTEYVVPNGGGCSDDHSLLIAPIAVGKGQTFWMNSEKPSLRFSDSDPDRLTIRRWGVKPDCVCRGPLMINAQSAQVVVADPGHLDPRQDYPPLIILNSHLNTVYRHSSVATRNAVGDGSRAIGVVVAGVVIPMHGHVQPTHPVAGVEGQLLLYRRSC